MVDWKTVIGCLNGPDKTVASLRCLPAIFANVLTALFMFAGSVAVIIIIISGIRFILAGGDAKQVETAQKAFMYAILGLILVFLSYFILNIIATVTGVSCILVIGPWHTGNCLQ